MHLLSKDIYASAIQFTVFFSLCFSSFSWVLVDHLKNTLFLFLCCALQASSSRTILSLTTLLNCSYFVICSNTHLWICLLLLFQNDLYLGSFQISGWFKTMASGHQLYSGCSADALFYEFARWDSCKEILHANKWSYNSMLSPVGRLICRISRKSRHLYCRK